MPADMSDGKIIARHPLMSGPGRLFLAAAVLSLLLASVAWADGIVLLNGIRVTGVIERADRHDLEIVVAAGRRERHSWRNIYSVQTDPLPGEKQIAAGAYGPEAAAAEYLRLESRLTNVWQQALVRRRAVVCYQRAGLVGKALDAFIQGKAGGQDSVHSGAIPIFEPSHARVILERLARIEKGDGVSPYVRAMILGLRADSLIALNRLDEAEGVVRALLAGTDGVAVGLGRIRSARIAQARGDDDRALALLEAAGRELGVAFQGDVGYWRARILLKRGRREEAILAAMEVALRYGFIEDRAARCLQMVVDARRQGLRFREAEVATEMLKRRYGWFPRGR